MSFADSAQSSLQSNRKLRSSIHRDFTSAKYDFSVYSGKKLSLDDATLQRIKVKQRKSNRSFLLIMAMVLLLFGMAFFGWLMR